jgi:Fe-Mn family superoxide dismutase
VNKLNELIPGTEFQDLSLEQIILKATGPIFNNAAQIWNHTFFWNCLSPKGGGEPGGKLADAIRAQFGSFAQFKEKFSAAAVGQFGSGWAWLSRDREGRLVVESTSNALNPMKEGRTALLTCDVWEHAYYIDYRHARPKFVEAFWNLVNWDFVASNMK